MFGLFKSKKVPPGMIGEVERITALLQGVKEQSAVVALRIPGSEAWYNSKVLLVESRQGLVVLDRIQEEKGHERMIRTRRFHALTRNNGILSFNAELLPATKQEKVTRYVIRLPELVEYQDRRSLASGGTGSGSSQDEGSSLTPLTSQAAITLMGKGRAVRGFLSGISLTELELRTRDIVPFQPGDEIPSCTFELHSVSVSCRLKLLDTQLDTFAHETRLRCEILDLPDSQRLDLSRAIAGIHREQ